MLLFTVFLTIKSLIIAVPFLLYFFQDESLQQVSYQPRTKQTVAFPDTDIIQVSSVGTDGTIVSSNFDIFKNVNIKLGSGGRAIKVQLLSSKSLSSVSQSSY